MQKGYPSRIPYTAIHERYKSAMPDFVQARPQLLVVTLLATLRSSSALAVRRERERSISRPSSSDGALTSV